MFLLKNSLSPLLNKPDPTLYGWCYEDEKLTTTALSSKLPAPTEMILRINTKLSIECQLASFKVIYVLFNSSWLSMKSTKVLIVIRLAI